MRSQQNKQSHSPDRRLNWHERRAKERRNPYRVFNMQDDCRRGIPRREADITGAVNEVDVWWELEYPAR